MNYSEQDLYSKNPIGRNNTISQVIDLIKNKHQIINIHGVLGIGKSTVCSCAIDRLKYEYNSYTISARGCNTYEMLLSRFLEVFECVYSSVSKNILKYELNKISLHKPILIYIDNFEDCVSENEIIEFITELYEINSNINILLSTRCTVEGWYNYEIKPLDVHYCIELFKNSYGNSFPISNKKELKDFLVKHLDRHTLSIKLVASKAYFYKDLQDLIKAWNDEKNTFTQKDTIKKDSLVLSVNGSYKIIKNNEFALFIWCCLAFFPQEIPYKIFNKIFENNLPEAKSTIHILIKYNLIEYTENGYYMLQPIRDIIFDFINIKSIKLDNKDPLDKIFTFFSSYDGLEEVFPIVCYALIFALKNNLYTGHKHSILSVIWKCQTIYKRYPYMSISLVESIINHILPYDKTISEFCLYKQLADLYHIVGNNVRAIEFYDKALSKYNENHLDEVPEKIRILIKKCEICRLFGDRESAINLIINAFELSKKTNNKDQLVAIIWQKAELYRLLDKDYEATSKLLLDLTNESFFKDSSKKGDIYWSLGESYYSIKKKKSAREFIEKAINEFSDNNNNYIGLGYAYLSLAKLNINLKNSNSEFLFKKSLEMFNKIEYDLGLGHVYLCEGKYYKKIDHKKSNKCIKLAFDKYTKVGYVPGIKETKKLLNLI